MHSPNPTPGTTPLNALLAASIEKRRALFKGGRTQAFRAFSGAADGLDGVFIDVYAQGAVIIVYDDVPRRQFDPQQDGAAVLAALSPLGVRGVYLKRFARDRSRMGGELPEGTLRTTPLIGEPLPEHLLIHEHSWVLEVRLYDGLSTGLFLDQRDNRAFVAQRIRSLAARPGAAAPAVLNAFAYTCAFSIAAATAGAITTSVDVSPRYLDWGRRNFEHNSIDPAAHWFAKMDTFEFLAYARRKAHRYDLIILDPPSFGSGSKKKGIRPWSSVNDYSRLVYEAAQVLAPRGMILASTNTQDLCRGDRLSREVIKGLEKEPTWVKLPPIPLDFARDRERFRAVGFTPESHSGWNAP